MHEFVKFWYIFSCYPVFWWTEQRRDWKHGSQCWETRRRR